MLPSGVTAVGLRSDDAAARRGNASKIAVWLAAMRTVASRRGRPAARARRGRRRSAGTSRQPQQQPPAASSRRRTDPPPAARSSAPASTSSASTSSSPTSNGNPVARPEADRLRGHRGRQAAEDRDLQAGQARRRRDADAPMDRRAQIRTDDDEEIGSGARRRPAVRDLPRRLPRAARREPVGARDPISRFVETQLGPVGHDRRDVSARVDRRRCA